MPGGFRWRGFIFGLLLAASASWAWATAAQPEDQETIPHPVSQPEETLKDRPPPERGFLGEIGPPSLKKIQDFGPVTGAMAPYGNPSAQDTLVRGWSAHRLGPGWAMPYLELASIYDSNIFQTAGDPKADFIQAVYPGLGLRLPLAGRHNISVAYLGHYFLYLEHKNVSHYDHNASLNAEFNFRGGLTFQMGNAFRRATEIPSAEIDRKRPYIRETPYFTATHAVSDRWKVQAGYQFDLLQYDDNLDKINNYRYNTGSFALFYKFWPKTSLLGQCIIESRNYPSQSIDNSMSYTPVIGLAWEPTAKISGTIKVGYTFREYAKHMSGRDNSPDSWMISWETLYRCSRYDNFYLMAQRALRDDVDFGNLPYASTGVFFSWHHDWHYFKAASYVKVSYGNDAYLQSTFDPNSGGFKRRNDDLISAGFGLSRPLRRWLRLRLDYLYVNRSSNFAGFTYHEHRFLLGLQGSR